MGSRRRSLVGNYTIEKEFLCELRELNGLKSKTVFSKLYQKNIILILDRSKIYAWLDACPHYPQATPLSWKTGQYLSKDEKFIQCFAHGALFNLKTGLCEQGPCMGKKLSKIPLVIVSEQIFCLGSL